MQIEAQRIDATTVRFQRLLPGPIERVWAYVTEADKRRLWLAGGEFELRVGGAIELHFENATLSPLPDDDPPEKYADMPARLNYRGVVTRCEPPVLLAHTWIDENMESEVEYRLESRGESVLLTITHRRLTDPSTVTGVMGGWHTHVDMLSDVLAGRTPQPFWRSHTALEALYENIQQS